MAPGETLGITQPTAQVTPEVALVGVLQGEMTRKELQLALALKDGEHSRKHYLLPALASDLIEMTLPDKPNSRLQKYRLTRRGNRAAGSARGPGAT